MDESATIDLISDTDADFLDHLSELDSVRQVLESTRKQFSGIELKRLSYHFTPPFHSQTSERVIVFADGFPAAWLEKYADPEFRASDPIPDFIMAAHRPMAWRTAIAEHPDRQRADAFWAELKKFGLVNGIGIPLYGPGGRDAYSSIAIDRPFDETDKPFVRRIRIAFQTAHLRISHLVLEEINEGAQLSMRETEVLSWIIAGKSKNDIAGILEISAATVDTYLRRIYAKLEVNDRVKASLVALSRGLVRL